MSARAGLGRMRSRVQIEQPTETIDDAGGRAIALVEVGSAFAGIARRDAVLRGLNAGESLRVTHRIRMRVYDGIAPGWRLRMGECVYDIRAVSQDDQGAQYIVCDCEEVESAP